jgi:hypothetical protein
MVNFPPVDSGNNRINLTKKNSNRRVMASTETVTEISRPVVDRRRMGDRRRRGAKQIIDRRMIRDRRRSSIDLTV